MSTVLFPLVSFIWSDEFPDDDFKRVGSDSFHRFILRIVGDRLHFWKTGSVADSDRDTWQFGKELIPEWPLFQRLKLSGEQEATLDQIEENFGGDFEEAFGDDE